MSRTTLLITGATGFLGARLLELASARPDLRVATLSRTRKPPGGTGPGTVCDVRDRPAVASLLDATRPAVILHTAYSKVPDEMESVIVDGTRVIAEEAEAIGATLLHLSTDLVFDGATGGYDESARPAPILPYGKAKLEAERIVLGHPRAVVVRPSLIYDPHAPAPCEDFVLAAVRAGKRPTLHGWEFRSPVYRQELASALLALAGRAIENPPGDSAGSDPSGRIFHAGGRDRVSRHEFAALLAPFRGHDAADLLCQEQPPDGAARPADCSLVSARLETALAIPLRGVREVTREASSRPGPPDRLG